MHRWVMATKSLKHVGVIIPNLLFLYPPSSRGVRSPLAFVATLEARVCEVCPDRWVGVIHIAESPTLIPRPQGF